MSELKIVEADNLMTPQQAADYLGIKSPSTSSVPSPRQSDIKAMGLRFRPKTIDRVCNYCYNLKVE